MKVAVALATSFEQDCMPLIDDDGAAAVTNPGNDIDHTLTATQQHDARIEKILFTHDHADYCAAVGTLCAQSGVSIEGLQEDEVFWIDQLPMQSQCLGFPPAKASASDRRLEDGDTMEAAGRILQMFYCPGRIPGYVVFFNAEDRVVIAGGVLFAGSIGRTDFPCGNYTDPINAIRTKLRLLGDDVMLASGHRLVSTFGDEHTSNPYAVDRLSANEGSV